MFDIYFKFDYSEQTDSYSPICSESDFVDRESNPLENLLIHNQITNDGLNDPEDRLFTFWRKIIWNMPD